MRGLGIVVVWWVAAGLSIAACSGGPRKKDAQDLIKVLEAIASVQPDQRLAIMAEGCSELAACAPGECSRALHDVAGVMPEQRGLVLAKGCSEFAARVDPGKPIEPQMVEYIEGKYRALADEVRKGLDTDLKRRLDAAMQSNGLL